MPTGRGNGYGVWAEVSARKPPGEMPGASGCRGCGRLRKSSRTAGCLPATRTEGASVAQLPSCFHQELPCLCDALAVHGQREGLATHWEMWSFVQGGMTPQPGDDLLVQAHFLPGVAWQVPRMRHPLRPAFSLGVSPPVAADSVDWLSGSQWLVAAGTAVVLLPNLVGRVCGQSAFSLARRDGPRRLAIK